MTKYKMKHTIVNCENTDSVTPHDLYPSPVTNCHTFSDPFPLERDILYGRPLGQILRTTFLQMSTELDCVDQVPHPTLPL